MAIKKLFDFLKKFDDLLATSTYDSSAVVEAIREITGVVIESSLVQIKAGIIYLSLRGVEKSEILIRRADILARANDKTKKTFKDIR